MLDQVVADRDHEVGLVEAGHVEVARLQADRAKIWTTDHITYHKYLQERKGAKATITSANDQQIRLALSSDADATLYDQPLTLRTRVPAGWKTCTVAQGESRATAQVTNGIAVRMAVLYLCAGGQPEHVAPVA